MPSSAHTSIKHFLVEDGQRVNNVYQRSILLEIQRELWYTTSLSSKPITYKDFEHKIDGSPPRLAPILLFTSAIDLIARVDQCRLPTSTESSVFFKKCCIKYFGFSEDSANQFWNIRTSLVHQYKLPNGTLVSNLGPVDAIIDYDKTRDINTWLFPYYMPRNLNKVIKHLAMEWLSETASQKIKRAVFIDEYGFFYHNELFNLSERKYKKEHLL